MAAELLLCIPGPWVDRSEFARTVITLEPKGRYMFAGLVLADIAAKDHVLLEIHPADPHMSEAFRLAGQGKLPPELLLSLERHKSVAYLHFSADLMSQRERVLSFSQVVRSAGDIAVKVESAGVAHTWERWTGLLEGTPFERYCAVVTLIGDEQFYYSCGMHHFGLPECEVPRSLKPAEAADLMNRFNFWQVVEDPTLTDGHTFSVARDSPHFVLGRKQDMRHEPGHPFFNPHGIWHLDEA
jgi:hypothetical protein